MKIFVAGATGAVGKVLVPLLVEAGHHVVGMTRSADKALWLQTVGAEAVVADALDRTSVGNALVQTHPEIVIHQMTGLSGVKSFRRFDDGFALTNRLRTEGTDYLLEAARAAGVRRVIAQSFGNWNYQRSGSGLKAEQDSFDPHPPTNQRKTLAAIRYVEDAVVGTEDFEGIALRYGNFYGPGTGFEAGGQQFEMVRKRRWPVIGDGAGVWSFIHTRDAAAATIAAVERGQPGVYNIVDDEPAPVAVWLPELAAAIGAKAPRRIPVWLGRLATGQVGVSLMTQIRGASNGKAKLKLGWEPGYKSWREGFRSAVGR
jgi:nucleoside-diphosphate-sugar epimerase